MALRRFSFPIIFALMLLFAQVLADKKDTTVKDSDAEVDQYGYGHGPYGRGPYGRGPYGRGPYGPYPGRCRFYCGRRCCSEAEFAAYSQAEDQVNQVDDQFGDEKQYGYGPGPRYGYGGRPGYGYGPPRCRYFCGRRCCSAEQYAEFMQNQN